jgi:hypothetical protein
MSARRSIVSFAHGINRVVPGNEPIYFTHMKDALPFYARREFRELDLDPHPRAVVSTLASRKQGYFLVSQDAYDTLSVLGKDQLMFEVLLRHVSSEKNNAIPLLFVHFVTRQ